MLNKKGQPAKEKEAQKDSLQKQVNSVERQLLEEGVRYFDNFINFYFAGVGAELFARV